MRPSDVPTELRPEQLLQVRSIVRKTRGDHDTVLYGWKPGEELRRVLRRRRFDHASTRVLFVVRVRESVTTGSPSRTANIETKYRGETLASGLTCLRLDTRDEPEVLAFIVDRRDPKSIGRSVAHRDRRKLSDPPPQTAFDQLARHDQADRRILLADGQPDEQHDFWRSVAHYLPVPFRPQPVETDQFVGWVRPSIPARFFNWYWK